MEATQAKLAVDPDELENLNIYRSELLERAQLIAEWAKDRNISNRQLERRFPGIGSEATLSRILAREWDRVNAERQLPNYRAVCLLLEEYDRAEKRNEKLLDGMSRVLTVESAIKQAMLNDDNTRLVMVQGPSASGKSTSVQLATAKLRGYEVVATEADESWRDSTLAMATGIIDSLSSVSIKRKENSKGTLNHIAARTAMNEVYKRIDDRAMVLIIDQADELGPKTLNFCTSIINKCPRVVLVLISLETLWNSLETKHYEVCRQLRENRLSARISFQHANAEDPVWVNDATMLLKDRVNWEKPTLPEQAARLAAKEASGRGNLKFLTLAIRQVRSLYPDKEIGLQEFAVAMTRVRASR